MSEMIAYALGTILAIVFVTHDVTPEQISTANSVCVTNNGMRSMTVGFNGDVSVSCVNGASFKTTKGK